MAISDAEGDPQVRKSCFLPMMRRIYLDEVKMFGLDEVKMFGLDEEAWKSLGEISGLYGDEILLRIFRVVGYHEDEARRRWELNSLPEELRRKLERMAEAEAGVNELMGKLEVLFELFLYVCLILETSTSKKTRRSKEDKCIVHILLLRSGVESNPGPKTWIAEIPPEMPAADDDIAYLSKYIGKGWQNLGRKLGLGPATLDHIEHDFHQGGMRDQIYHMLLKVKAPPLEATLKNILETLDIIEAEFSITVEWSELSLRFRTIRQNQLTEQEKILALQAENEELKTENQELKEKLASLERDSGALKRCSEDGDAATGVKKIKHE